MKFAPEYITYVLNENFEDAKALLLSPMMAINYAHLVMLADRGIVSAADAHTLRAALDGVSQDVIREVKYDGSYEDLFFYVESLVIQACGEDVAGRLHTARSRNDIDMTMYRMRQREFVLGLLTAAFELRRSLLDVVDRHRDTILAVHTHTQRAQPTTVAHYLLAVVEQLERDVVRLKGAYDRTNRNPLGACAITGTGFPIDRQLTSDLLGFCGPTCNTYGSIATVDYLLESASAAAVLLVGHGRFVQDLLLWSTSEFGYVCFGDGFVQCSSSMPPKRNPGAVDHARAVGGKAPARAQASGTDRGAGCAGGVRRSGAGRNPQPAPLCRRPQHARGTRAGRDRACRRRLTAAPRRRRSLVGAGDQCARRRRTPPRRAQCGSVKLEELKNLELGTWNRETVNPEPGTLNPEPERAVRMRATYIRVLVLEAA